MKQIPVIAAAAFVLAAPAVAAAAPAVYTTTAKVVAPGQTPDASWTQSNLASEQRYVVANNGLAYSLHESNGKTSRGVLSYEVLPSPYRALFGKARWLAEAATGAQPHATCDAPALTTDDAVLSWQSGDPAYDYIPFQATSAGLGDDPATWLPKIKQLTGLTLTPSSDLAAACASIGGTFAAADAVVADLTTPLEKQVSDLTAAKAKLEKDLAAAKLEATPFKVSVSSAATLQRGLDVNVTGPPNRPVFIRVLVTDKQRRELKIKYRTLGTGSGATDAKGKAVVTVQPRADTAPVLLRWQTPVPATIFAISGDRQASPIVYLGA